MMMDSFYNGFPIFYSDSNTYMLSGLELFFPADRPITYGLFIRIFSFNATSLWTVIFFQSLILSFLIFLTVKLLLGEKRFVLYSLIIILFLSFCTGLSWMSSQIMADIFTSITLLSLFLIVFGDTKKTTKILLYFIFCISVSMHLSHVVLFSCLIVIILFLRNWIIPPPGRKRTIVNLFVLLVLVLSAEFPMRPALDKSKYVFFMGAMVEQGIAKQYLDEYCGTDHYMLCPYKDSLPSTCIDFVWSAKSPFYKIGGWSSEVRDEFSDITYATLTKPKYIKLHVIASLKATLKQIHTFDIYDGNGPFTDSTGLVYAPILKYFKPEANSYIRSKQNNWTLKGIDFFISFYKYIVAANALLLVILLVLFRSVFTSTFKSAVVLFLFTILLSDWDLSTFSCVANRFGCKVMWLIPFLCTIAVFKLLDRKTVANNK